MNKYVIGFTKSNQILLWKQILSDGRVRTAAAGHSRSGAAGGGSAGGCGHQNGGSNGGTRGGSGGHGYGGSGGALGSGGVGGALGGGIGGGGGSMNPGGNGKSNYGPTSPPMASLPPFCESLKGGGLTSYSQQYSQYPALINQPLPMDCDTGQHDLTSGLNFHSAGGGGDVLSKQYSLLQNVCATYGITVKDDEDLSSYVKDNGGFLPYDDALMVDAATGSIVDPLQFTATLTFSSPADHSALLETLSDAADLFLRDVSNKYAKLKGSSS